MRPTMTWLAPMGILLVALACAPLAAYMPSPAPSAAPTATTIRATEAPPTATAISPPLGDCRVPPGAPPTTNWQAADPLAPKLLAYLNQGGSVSGLLDQLETAGLLPRNLPGVDVAWTDITGDGRLDVALSVVSPFSDALPPSGRLYLFVCQGDQYQLAFASPELPDYSAPVIHAAQDLTGDGQADLLISRTVCGAHTCTAQVEVLLWRSGALENRLEGVSDDLPSPVIEVRGPTPRGTFDIAVTGTGINSIGAGPYRQRTRTWSWDPVRQTYVPGADVLLDSDFRIHVLHDADQAAAMGDFATALALYSRVIEDDSLDDWISGDQGRVTLSAFAMYRRVLTFLLWGKPDEAEAAYQALLTAHPAGSPGGAYAQLAEALWSAYQSEGDLAVACTAAQDFAASNAEQVLDPLYFGYANPAYTASDVCPVGS